MPRLKRTTDFLEGMRVLYIPMHAEGNPDHRDCERGVVTFIGSEFVFVRYGNETHAKATSAAQLVEVTR